MDTLRMKPHDGGGLFLTFCGLDGCGKTTMIEKTAAYLDSLGYPLMRTKQPTDFVRNSGIFRTYMDCENHDAYDYRSLSLLAASDRIQHSNRVILPALKEGKTVISDRYFYSCLANLRARGYEEDRWIYEISEYIPKPDIAFFLDVPVETAVARVRSRHTEKDRYIDMTLQYRLLEDYQSICNQNGGILLLSDGSEGETFACVRKEIDMLLEKRFSLSKKVKELLGGITGSEDIREDSKLSEELGLDSLMHVSLILELEEMLGVEMDEADLNPFDLITVGDVIRLASKYMGGGE